MVTDDWIDGKDNTDKTEVDGIVETGVDGAVVGTGADETVETVEAGVDDGTGTETEDSKGAG